MKIQSISLYIPDNLPRPYGCAPERVESKRVTINGERKTIHLCAYGWQTRHSWGHAAFCPELGTTQKIVYYNRTWEAKRFDSVLSCLFEKCLLVDRKRASRARKEERERRKACKANVA